jgi:hypothetical protein
MVKLGLPLVPRCHTSEKIFTFFYLKVVPLLGIYPKEFRMLMER